MSTGPGPQGFDFLADRLGLDLLPPERVRRHVLASPFRFADQAVLLAPDDLPAPNERGFAESCIDAVERCVRASGGRAFVLFTSFSLLSRVHRALERRLRQAGLVPLRQGECSRHQLLDRFRNELGAVLFGTDSFWEGVDVRGRALENVVIVRLPFRVPSEPLLEARYEALEARGGNAFRELSLPHAVIRFRQGFGRLIRSRSDRGSVIVLDHRVRSRSYGRLFLRALPPGVPIWDGRLDELLTWLQRFYRGAPLRG